LKRVYTLTESWTLPDMGNHLLVAKEIISWEAGGLLRKGSTLPICKNIRSWAKIVVPPGSADTQKCRWKNQHGSGTRLSSHWLQNRWEGGSKKERKIRGRNSEYPGVKKGNGSLKLRAEGPGQQYRMAAKVCIWRRGGDKKPQGKTTYAGTRKRRAERGKGA